MPSIAVVLAVLATTAGGQPSRPAGPELPAEIKDHYRDYNFINAFSTFSERRLLVNGRVDSSDPRLGRVARAMRRLADRVDQVDPGIIAPSGRRPAETTERADLLRVTSFDLDGGEAWVYLETLALDPPATASLVSRFDDLASSDREPSVDQLAAAAGRPLIRTFEIHHWRRVDGAWRRESTIRHFIAR